MRDLSEGWKRILAVMAFGWAAAIIYTAVIQPFHPFVQGSSFLALGLVFIFVLYPARKRGAAGRSPSVLDFVLIALTLGIWVHILLFNEEWQYNPMDFGTLDHSLGIVLLFLILEGARRIVGLALPILGAVFLLYALFGAHVPGYWGHAGFSSFQIFRLLYHQGLGYFGIVTTAIVYVVAPFLLFAPVLMATGTGRVFMDVAKIAGARLRGGPAQVATISSAFFGSISGSPAANVATTGAVTIPAMKKAGYTPEQAGGVESAASTSGQIMPPVMSVAAFVMAELTGIPYIQIAKAALIPAILYIGGIMAGVYFFSSRSGIARTTVEDTPRFRDVVGLSAVAKVALPFGALLWLLMQQYPAQFAAISALVVAMGLHLILGQYSAKALKDRVVEIWHGVQEGIRSTAWIMVLVLCIQIVVSLIPLTGIGVKLASVAMGLAGESLLPVLLMAAAVCMVMGMGVPTVAAYVLTVSVVDRIMRQIGFGPMESHLFILYFATMSGLTPPVCPTAFVAAALARANWLKTAWYALRLAIPGFVVPFLFIRDKELLMQGEPAQVLTVTAMAIVIVVALEAAAFGYLLRPASPLTRLMLIASGLLVGAVPELWYVGLAGVAFVTAVQMVPRKKAVLQQA